jgi:hypothetical protein
MFSSLSTAALKTGLSKKVISCYKMIMSCKWILRIAGVLCLMTSAAHLIGTLMEIPAEQVAMLQTVEMMKQTMIPMPVGEARSYMDVLNGNNYCTSILLLLCGWLLFIVAKNPHERLSRSIITIIAFCLLGFAIISGVYFFPVPTVFTGVAGVLALVARFKHKQS